MPENGKAGAEKSERREEKVAERVAWKSSDVRQQDRYSF
jgi:hypothetical protein